MRCQGSSWDALGLASFVALFQPSKGSMVPTRSACHGASVCPHTSHGAEAMLPFLPVLATRARQPWLSCRHPRRTAGSTGA